MRKTNEHMPMLTEWRDTAHHSKKKVRAKQMMANERVLVPQPQINKDRVSARSDPRLLILYLSYKFKPLPHNNLRKNNNHNINKINQCNNLNNHNSHLHKIQKQRKLNPKAMTMDLSLTNQHHRLNHQRNGIS